MRQRVHRRLRREPPGGIVTYGTEHLHEEVSYIAYHLHWPLDQLLDLEHQDRRRYLRLVQNLCAQNRNGR
ncbi:DUF6760 family protein [Mycolicibacterium monacense]|uniref:DUF6760 family protein n=1 Tax=Mycolicibacterium monacense TaxID=85693 RepID=UPI002AFB0ACE|nr:hypothetical protein [Mycolicibacterium monacense DSM 44395]